MYSKNEKVRTIDGFVLDVIEHHPEVHNKKLIIMCHGLTGCKQGIVQTDTHLMELADKLCEKGFQVIQFDWRGHGKSSGADLDVSCESFLIDLDTIVQRYKQANELYFWGWSIGGFAITQYLLEKGFGIDKAVLWSPVLDPCGSFVYNKNSNAFYRNIVDTTKDGSLYEKGFALWPAKNFKMSQKFLAGLRKFDFLRAISRLPKQTLIIVGNNDVLVDKSYAENYAREFDFEVQHLDANHALMEKMPDAIRMTIDYF